MNTVIRDLHVFLGGTCGDSKWRNELIPMLEIESFNPVVPEWNEKAQLREIYERANCDYCLYVLTPETDGYYSIAEVIEDSIKRPQKTIFCLLEEYGGKAYSPARMKQLNQVGKMVVRNGGVFLDSLENVANYLNRN